MSEPWSDWPEAGPDDWEPCPKCANMDGGCPFCGHGMVPKQGFQWPTAGRRRLVIPLDGGEMHVTVDNASAETLDALKELGQAAVKHVAAGQETET